METKTKKIENKPARVTGGFDAIKVMREIRDKISLEIMDMDYEEERAYLDKLIADGQVKTK